MPVLKNNLTPKMFDTPLFTEVFPDQTTFLDTINNMAIPVKITAENLLITYYLLYAQYGNTPIAYPDVNLFKYNLAADVFMYGPTWETRLGIQDKIRGLSDAELQQGSKAIYNQAINPAEAQSTQTLEELTTLNAQNTTNYKKSKLDALESQWEMLATDVTQDYLNKFSHLFMNIASYTNPILFVTEDED